MLKQCLIIEAFCHQRMICLQLFVNGVRLFQQRLRFSILSALAQIIGSLVEQMGCIREKHLPAIDEVSTPMSMRQITFTQIPFPELCSRKDFINGSHDALSPDLLCCLIHCVDDYHLHQAMYVEGFGPIISADETVGVQGFQSVVEDIRVLEEGFQGRS